MKKKSLILLLILALMLSVFAACAPADKEGQTDTPPATDDPGDDDDDEGDDVSDEPSGQLIVGITEASGNFNPLYYSSAYDGYTVDLVFQSLIALNEKGEYVEELAESYEFSEDEKTITFKLREDVVFSDGTPLTAEDVVFTYLVLADPSYTGRYGSVVKDMVGYEEYYAGETDEFEGVKALGEYEVQFNFKEVNRVNLSNSAFAILPKHHYGKDFEPGDTSSVEAITTDALGSGPYKIENFQAEELVYLTRNENYNGEGYLIKDIIMKFVDETTDIVELTQNNIDYLPQVIQPEKIKQARDAGFKINKYPRSGYGYVKTNHESGPTAEKEVRQALYYGFNIEEFVNSYFKDPDTGDVLATTQAHPFSVVDWSLTDELVAELNDYEFDLDKANQILDEAGWELNESDGIRYKDGKPLKLNIAAMPDHDILATLIPMWERDWGKGMGVQLDVAYLEFNTMLDYVIYNSDDNVDEWSVFFLAMSISSMDPHTHYSSFHSDHIGSGQNNTSRYSNPEVDRLFDEGKKIMDPEEAAPIYAEIVKILNEEAVMMPVYSNTYHDLYAEKLVDFETDSLWSWVQALRDARVVE